MNRVTCPLCSRTHPQPVEHVPSTPWTDDCACTDQGRCVAHQVNPDNAPVRPSDEKMRARAAQRIARDKVRWRALKDHLKQAEDWVSKLEALQGLIDERELWADEMIQPGARDGLNDQQDGFRAGNVDAYRGCAKALRAILNEGGQ